MMQVISADTLRAAQQRPHGAYTAENARPLIWVVVVSCDRLSGSSGLPSTTEREVVIDCVKPVGRRVVRLVSSGASMPKRGSGPEVTATTLPSGRVVVVEPLAPRTLTARVASG